jgi:tetratricopeptide (TPR) repeat protein
MLHSAIRTRLLGITLSLSARRSILAALAVGVAVTIAAITIGKRPTSRSLTSPLVRKADRVAAQLGHAPFYLDGLADADSAVVSSCTAGLDAMASYQWDSAISKFNVAAVRVTGQQAVALLSLTGACQCATGRLKQALANFGEEARLAGQTSDRQGRADALGNMGAVYFDRYELDSALAALDEALALHRALRNWAGAANVLRHIGEVHAYEGRHDLSLQYCTDALRLARRAGDSASLTAALRALGECCRSQGDWERALRFHTDALRIDREVGSEPGVALGLSFAGNIYYSKGELDSAVRYYEDALAIGLKTGDRPDIAMFRCNVGNALAQIMEKRAASVAAGGPAGDSEVRSLAGQAITHLAGALSMCLDMGYDAAPRFCRQAMVACQRVLGKEAIVAACESAGMDKDMATRTADILSETEMRGLTSEP